MASPRVPKVAWIYTINPGVTFYRMYQFIVWLSEAGLVNSYLFPDWLPSRLESPSWDAQLDQYMSVFESLVEKCDLFIVQYISSPSAMAVISALKDLKPTYMEIDDVVWAVPFYSCAFDSNKPGGSQDYWARCQMLASTGVVCSTEYLANQIREWNQNVTVIPNAVNFSLWDGDRPKNERVRIGWVGGATHEGDLKIVKDVIYEILNRYENAEVMICTSPPPSWPSHERLKLVNRWVTIDRYHELVKELNFDIGIAPLKDNYFNRAKSNLRYLEYSAMKIPTVASPVEPFLKDFAGYLCRTEDEWVDTLGRLIEDEALRKRDGLKAHDQVSSKYSLERIALRYYEFIMGALKWDYQYRPASQGLKDLSQALL